LKLQQLSNQISPSFATAMSSLPKPSNPHIQGKPEATMTKIITGQQQQQQQQQQQAVLVVYQNYYGIYKHRVQS
jgi:hypothetical protein